MRKFLRTQKCQLTASVKAGKEFGAIKMLLSEFLKGLKDSLYMQTKDAMYTKFVPEPFSEEERRRQKEEVLKETYPDIQLKDSLPEIDFHGLTLVIENPEGSVRRGEKEDGSKWKTTFFHPYGFIKGTMGSDGEEIDCFLGPHPESQMVYIIRQNRNGKFDEHKVMLGFDNEEHARDAYLAHFDTQGKLGEIMEVPIHCLKQALFAMANDAESTVLGYTWETWRMNK